MDYSTARKYAFRLVSMRGYHSVVLFDKLEKKGFPKDISEKVVEECKRLGFIKDDEAILREWRRGYGPRYISFKLGVDIQEVRNIVTRQMQREKVKELKAKGKQPQFLQRHGFDLDIIFDSA